MDVSAFDATTYIRMDFQKVVMNIRTIIGDQHFGMILNHIEEEAKKKAVEKKPSIIELPEWFNTVLQDKVSI